MNSVVAESLAPDLHPLPVGAFDVEDVDEMASGRAPDPALPERRVVSRPLPLVSPV
jgi:hypothetical protein